MAYGQKFWVKRTAVLSFFVQTLILQFLLFSASSMLSADTVDALACRHSVAQCLERMHDSLINSWTELDILRSVTINQNDRPYCAQRLFAGIITLLLDTQAFAATCSMCMHTVCAQQEEVLQLSDLLEYLMDSFKAVFMPLQNGDERVLAELLVRAATILDDCSKNQSQCLHQKSNYE